MQDGEAADARVEDADRARVGHGAIVGAGLPCRRETRSCSSSPPPSSGRRRPRHSPSRPARGRWPTARRSPTTSTSPTARRRPAAGPAWSSCTASAARRTTWRRSPRSSPRTATRRSPTPTAAAGPRRATSSSPARTRSSDERAMLESFFAGLPQVSDTADRRVGHLLRRRPGLERARRRHPVQGCGGASRPGPTSTARSGRRTSRKSGIVLGFAKRGRRALAADRRSTRATRSSRTNMPAIKTLAAPRSAYTQLPSITTPVYMFQGRVDYAFDVDAGRERLHAHHRPEAPLHRAVRPPAVDVPRPRRQLRALAGRSRGTTTT